MKQIPFLIHKDLGKGSSSNLGIDKLGNRESSCLCARDYKGISRMSANAVIVAENEDDVKILGFNLDADGESVRNLKAQYQKNSASNFCRSGSYGASAVMVFDEQNKYIRSDGYIGTIMADGSSPKKNNRVAIIKEGDSLTIDDVIKENNKSAKHQQDLLQHKDDTCRNIPAGTHGSTPHLLKTVIDERPLRIRKLTPRETWRLQGWSDENFDKARNAGVSDSQLYKQAGNGCSRNIVEVIGRKLREIELEEQQENEESTLHIRE